MTTTCKRLMVRKEVKSRNQYGEYTSMADRIATTANIKRFLEIRGIDDVSRWGKDMAAGPGEEGIHECGGQIVATVENFCYGESIVPEFQIEYVCDRCKRMADKESVGIGHWPDNVYELETWLNQLLKDR